MANPRPPTDSKEEKIRLLLVTFDDNLYFSIRMAAVNCGWELWKASNVDQGLRLMDESRAQLVIVDWNPDQGDDWQAAVDRFVVREDHPCILLASKVIDDYLLRELVRHGGFDAIARSSTEEQFIRSIRFAHFALRHSNPPGGRPFLR